MVKNPSANVGDGMRVQSLGRRAQTPTPIFLPEDSHGRRNLEGYSPWDRKESDTTEATQHTHLGGSHRSH